MRTNFACALRWCAVLLSTFFSCAEAQTIPWVLPWNDASPGVTDFTSLNGTVTNGLGRVTLDGAGHLAAGGRRIRFLGVNFAGDSPFMPTNNADGVAARLAKFGVNGVRFHHMDAAWAYNGGLLKYTSTSSTNVNAAQLERVHFLVSRLKAHGIYSDINLLVGREYRSGDGLGSEVVGMDWKDAHILGLFHAPALALHKDYATKVLAPVNRFTGLALAQDPAVAFLEILNENGLMQKWLDGGLDRLPARYAADLQRQWNDWLAARYSSDTALQTAWQVIDQPLGTNLLANGAFSNGVTAWVLEQHNLARAAFTRTYEFTNGQPSARVNVTTADSVSWYIQLNQANLKLSSTQAYTVSFWAKASPATNADASVMRAHDDYANLGYSARLDLSTNWQFYTQTFQPTTNDANARVNFGSMGDKLGTFWFADVRLQAGGQLGTLPSGASLAAHTVPNLVHEGAGFAGTRAARRDWLRFLRSLESAYYDAMVAHLRDTLGYQGLIFGTIMANSPATVQSRLDIIDGHAYWQHPQFPGTPWDPVNWNIQNISMVNTVGEDNALAGLARQRIRGKPFFVTEYQHPSPNYFGGEGPLLLAAYAGLQDWDGIWLFDYGQGNPAVPMGYVRSFFEIGQHPTKMPNLLLAAALFRRGDVKPASQEITMALTPDRELDLLLNTGAWSVFGSGQLGVSSKLAFTNRLNTAVGEAPPGRITAPTGPAASDLRSDTGQLRWNAAAAAKGLVTVDTPRTKALVGVADNQVVNLGGLAWKPGPTKLGWCTLGITLTRGEVFTNDCSALVVATGWWENTGQVWTDASKTSLGNQWGRSPVLAEVVPFTLTLPVGTNRVHVWSLGERGQRKAALPLTGDEQSSTLSVSSSAATLWYEIVVDRWMASFDLWRARYFSEAELTDPSVSGEAASPDGDSLPNLWKYYVGLPGRVAAGSERLPRGGWWSDGTRRYLAMFLTRDPLARDVDCQGAIAAEWPGWQVGAPFVFAESPNPAGDLEQVIIHDASPATDHAQRFLQLRLQRR